MKIVMHVAVDAGFARVASSEQVKQVLDVEFAAARESLENAITKMREEPADERD